MATVRAPSTRSTTSHHTSPCSVCAAAQPITSKRPNATHARLSHMSTRSWASWRRRMPTSSSPMPGPMSSHGRMSTKRAPKNAAVNVATIAA